ncbi:MAG: MBL fold metallo-hydrolase [Xanthomonadales bacterium]|nr:MBL fold metallo-hydrolase [Xanthomonadales bacterium]
MRRPLTLVLATLAPLAWAQPDWDAVEVEATPVQGQVWLVEGAGGNIGVLAGEDGAVLVDDQYAPLTPKLQAAVAELTGGPVRFVLNTHWHGDHTGGNENLGAAGAVIVAHHHVRERMSSEQFREFTQSTIPASPDGALPVVTFEDGVTLHVNGEPVTAYHLRHAHTDGDSIVHFEGSDVLHLGDVFFNQLYPFIDRSSGGSVQGMIAAVAFAETLCGAGTKVIPGHGPVTDCAGLAAYRALLERSRDRVQALLDEGMSLEQVVAAKPTADTDETWSWSFIGAEDFVTFVAQSLQAPPPSTGRP